MSDQPTYEELVLRCQRLANIIVRNNNANEMLLRAEVKKAKAQAWEEGLRLGVGGHPPHTTAILFKANPYKENLS